MLERAKNYPGLQIGSYRLIRLLGEGGFSQVYLGEHIYLKTQSAIKLLRISLSPDVRDNFLHEAQTIAKLEHPNIIRVFDYGVAETTPFLVMNYAPNGSLRQRYPIGTRLPLSEIIPILKQIAPALDYAHQRRLIHRDVKPENILIGEQDQMFLSDFGLVLEAHSHSSQTVGKAAGTVLYMAPEQFQGKVRFASDQYALAIIVYQWLCGECPFKGTFTEIISQHLYTMPSLLSARIPDFPPIVEKAILKALAKDPTERYESTVAFVNALQAAYDSSLSHLDVYHTVSEDGEELAVSAAALASDALAAPDGAVRQTNDVVLTSLEQKKVAALFQEPADLVTQVPGTQPSVAPRRFNPLWRIALPLIALFLVIAGSVGIWYGSMHSLPGITQRAQTPTAQGNHTVIKTPHNNTPLPGKSTKTGTASAITDPGINPGNGSTNSTRAGNVQATAPGGQPTQPNATAPVTQPTTGTQPTPVVDCLTGSPTTLVFTSYKREPNPPPDFVTLTNCGGNSDWNASVQTNDGNDWLSVSPSSDNIPLNGSENIAVSVIHNIIPRGTYQGTILFSHGSATMTLTVINIVKKNAKD